MNQLEGKFDQISKKLDMIISGAGNLTVSSTQSQKDKQLREHFSKIGNSKDRCYKLKKCYRCSKLGHIAKFCKTTQKDQKSSSGGNSDLVENSSCVSNG